MSDPRLGSRNYQDLANTTDQGHAAILAAIKTVVNNRDISRAAQLEYLNRALVGLSEAQAAAKAREAIGREANKEFQRLDKIIEKLRARVAELEGKEPIPLDKKRAAP
jgi:hypothetical protein